MRDFFRDITGFPPRNYQIRLAEIIESGKNVVMTAPTGAGKTWAALIPFLHSRSEGNPIADKVIYVLPLRSLASSLYQSVKERLKTSLSDVKVTIQTGERSEDPFFRGDIVFTTLDQLLSAYIGLPFGTSRASSNIPPGALIGAYVIIDEFHLLSFEEALLTFLDMMKRLQSVTQFLVMTATAPENTVSCIARHLRGVSFKLTQEEMSELPKRQRSVVWRNEPLTADIVVSEKKRRTLVIVNTVKRAQKLYMDLQQKLLSENSEFDVKCLHSQFFQEDRKKAEVWLIDHFKKSEKPVILISTQVVEAGLDISSDILFTDLCPANALLQRAGRCARYGEIRGEIHVFSVKNEKGVKDYHPYLENYENNLSHPIILTEYFLSKHSLIACLTSKIEEEMIEQCHAEKEKASLEHTFRFLGRRKIDIENALTDGHADTASLIRDMDNISVIIHPKPEELRLELRPDRLSLSRSTLRFYLQGVDLEPPVAFVPVLKDNEGPHQEVKWMPVKEIKEIYRHTLVCLSPLIVDYRKDVGLLLKPPAHGEFIQSRYLDSDGTKSVQRFSYARETYISHAMQVRLEHRKQMPEVAVATKKLAVLLNIHEQRIHIYSEAVCSLHDVGKLTEQFQQKLKLWQLERKHKPEKEPIAHTDFDAENKQDVLANRDPRYARPPHAVEGAIIAESFFRQVISDIPDNDSYWEVLDAMRFTVMRHHSAFAHQYKEFKLVSESQEVIRETLHGLVEQIDFSEFMRVNRQVNTVLDDVKSQFVKEITLLCYWYFVRRLRFADQASQSDYS